jgi:hypothetical protein
LQPLIVEMLRAKYRQENGGKLADTNELLEARLSKLQEIQKRGYLTVKKIRDDGRFPQFIFDQLKEEHHYSSLNSLASFYQNIKTPEYLSKAERAVTLAGYALAKEYPEEYMRVQKMEREKKEATPGREPLAIWALDLDSVSLSPPEGIDLEAPPEEAPELAILLKRFREATQHQLGVERNARAERPKLDKACRLLAEASDLWEKNSAAARNRVEGYIEDNEENTEVKALYKALTRAMRMMVEHSALQSACDDPALREYVLDVAQEFVKAKTEKAGGKVEPQGDVSPEAALQEYMYRKKIISAAGKQKVQEVAQRNLLPQFIFDHLEDEARYLTKMSVLRAAIERLSPEELKQAIAAARNARRAMAKHYPHELRELLDGADNSTPSRSRSN